MRESFPPPGLVRLTFLPSISGRGKGRGITLLFPSATEAPPPSLSLLPTYDGAMGGETRPRDSQLRSALGVCMVMLMSCTRVYPQGGGDISECASLIGSNGTDAKMIH